MPQPLAGNGQGLQYPQNLYPNGLVNGVVEGNTNTFSLAPGDALPIPAGRFVVSRGKYLSFQYLDPVTGIWTGLRDLENTGEYSQIWSDGYNVRVVNLTGCVVGAVVTNGGSNGYVQSSTKVTPSTGTSTWQPIVGGAVNTTVSVTNVGANYGIAPLVFIDAPPSPGVPATGVANIASGTVTSITIINQGAGYSVAPNIAIYPQPYDPNFTSGTTAITNATATCSLTGAGSITACLLTNPGAPVASTMSLTVAGAGTTATIVPVFLQTVTAASVATTGIGYGASAQVTTTGGFNTNTPAFTSPQISLTGFVPRPAVIAPVATGGTVSSITTIYDGGLYLGTPLAAVIGNGIITTVAVINLTLGSVNDTVRIQQLS